VSGRRSVAGAFREPPSSERPISPPPSYGVPTEGGEMMPWEFVVEWLRASRNYWVATVGRNERPHSAPVWGVFVADDLFFETSPTTRKARNVKRNPAVVVHTESGDEVVIVEGIATPCRPSSETGRAIARGFAEKYDGYAPDPAEWENESLYRVEPRVVFAWRDMPTATCWRFP
jgi:nitroimidazol reductase NimA-like FMN-containing flavoprotein (pyridoxamine 5'-phosphate oxidase superfamily)